VAGETVYVGAEDGQMLAVDARTGTPRWRVPVAEPNPRAQVLFSPPVVDGERVLIGAADGYLHCVDARDGSRKWKAEAEDWIRARPFVQGSVVVAATLDGEVLAFRDEGDRAEPAWKTRVSRHELFGDVAGDDAAVYVTSSHLWLHALSIADGTQMWQQRLLPNGGPADDFALADEPPQIPQSSPTVAGGLAFVGGPNGLVQAVDIVTGARVWRYEVNGLVAAAPTVAGDKVLVGEYLGGTRFTAVEATTGMPLWSRDLGGVWASPEHEDGRIYVGTVDGWMYVLNAADGETRWRWKAGGGIYPAPALDEENVYFGSWDGHYYALDKASGAMAWAWSEPGYPYHIGGRPDSAAAVLHDGKLIVPALGGRYVAIDTKTAETLWTWFPPPGRVCNVTAAAHQGVAFFGVFGNTYIQPFGARLWAVDTRDGSSLWDLDTLGGLTSPVITGRGLLLCGSLNTPYIEAYHLPQDRTRPELAWRLRAGGNMYESLPAVSGDLAFFLSADGWLRAVK
jgi:outer membrane protein assembly factor BamB